MKSSLSGNFDVVSLDTDRNLTAEMYLIRVITVTVLVLTGGFFAGLTLGLMGLDETNLQVMLESGSESEKRNAIRVLDLLSKGKYWVLVTLLLSNVIVNETLPIVLDSIIGGGYLAVLISTALIVVFGEVIPQSICVRYGLAVGAKCSNIVLFIISDDDVDGLTEDEVNIIKSVLDLREKLVVDIMTPMEDVFTLSIHCILDEKLVHKILLNGYSRIPIKESDTCFNYIGMLLVKNLISYDSDDKLPVSHFPICPLPETFSGHMAVVSNNPGSYGGALGVITLEDVIEGLIGEEIVDETDVFVDVHKKIRVSRLRKRASSNSIRSHRLNSNIIIHSPSLTARSSDNTSTYRVNSNDSTGIKIRMKGYGAIVDSSGGNTNNTLSTSFQQQNIAQNNNFSSEPKL
ncbi:hypothetical protein INT48_009291 [Thamnidium elegans]|uniref:CNNM transmembrane domain-containing protein n=1 Tax=Thamnidium elegans TaxID=101142 RepID=A0A8H7VY44_9FUNG|nr:hypothetical protein INT48_009291 [Thamnidium elegans]